jgi:hypothetical protein
MTTNEPSYDFVDEGVPPSDNARVPGWLWLTYLTLPFWGIAWFVFFWNGSAGWFDRGAWHQLQQVANTTFPPLDISRGEKKILDYTE